MVIPYKKGLLDAAGRIFDKFGVSVVSKSFSTICNKLVEFDKVSECIYYIPCKKCDRVYVKETGRNLGVRVGQHKKEVEAKDASKFTKQSKKLAEKYQNKSAITDHARSENHVINWDQVKVAMAKHEYNDRTRWIKDVIAIHRRKDIRMNHVVLSAIQLWQTPSPWSSSFSSKWHSMKKS